MLGQDCCLLLLGLLFALLSASKTYVGCIPPSLGNIPVNPCAVKIQLLGSFSGHVHGAYLALITALLLCEYSLTLGCNNNSCYSHHDAKNLYRNSSQRVALRILGYFPLTPQTTHQMQQQASFLVSNQHNLQLLLPLSEQLLHQPQNKPTKEHHRSGREEGEHLLREDLTLLRPLCGAEGFVREGPVHTWLMGQEHGQGHRRHIVAPQPQEELRGVRGLAQIVGSEALGGLAGATCPKISDLNQLPWGHLRRMVRHFVDFYRLPIDAHATSSCADSDGTTLDGANTNFRPPMQLYNLLQIATSWIGSVIMQQ